MKNDGTFTYTPNGSLAASATGTDTFTYSAERRISGVTYSDTADVTFTVTGVNDAPVTVADTASTSEDTAVTVAVLANDRDPESSTLSVTAVSVTGGSSVGTATISGGSVVFTPAANYNGAATITYTASDGSATAQGTLTVTVAAVNDAPTNTLPATFSGTEDTVLALTGLSVADVDAGTAEISATLTVSSGTLTVLAGVTNGLAARDISGNGTTSVTLSGTVAEINATLAATNGLRFTPGANFNGDVTLTMSSSDDGATGSGGTKTDGDTATITIAAVNDTPVARADLGEVLEGGSVTVDVASNDSDVDGDALTVTGASVVGGAAIGAVTVNANGTVTFTPAEGYAGPALIDYTLSDGAATTTGRLSINVTGLQTALSLDGAAVLVAPTEGEYAGWSIVPRSATVIEGTGSVFINANQDPPTIEFRPGRDFVGPPLSSTRLLTDPRQSPSIL